MKNRLVSSIVVLLLTSHVHAQPADDQGVRAALNQYFRGHATAAMARATLVHGATTFT